MEIKVVRIRRNENLGNYESVHLEVEAQVGPGEKAAQVALDLDAWVKARLEQMTRPAERKQEGMDEIPF